MASGKIPGGTHAIPQAIQRLISAHTDNTRIKISISIDKTKIPSGTASGSLKALLQIIFIRDTVHGIIRPFKNRLTFGEDLADTAAHDTDVKEE